MGLYSDWFLPRLVDLGMRGEQFRELRPTCVAGARGRVLEVGFGSGLNLPFYGDEVEELLALDPAHAGRKLGRERIAAAPFPVRFVDLEGERLPLEDSSVDVVTSTWTLCTIADVESALREMRRVLRPGGELRFLEHGRSDDPRVAKWQDRLNGIQKTLCGGCHLNRKIDALVRGAGFDLGEVENFNMKGPKPHSYMYRGVARRPD